MWVRFLHAGPNNMIPRKLMYETDEGKLYDHFMVDIVREDRYLRFGYNATNDNVTDYLTKSLENYGKTDMWFIAESDNFIVGTVHVSITDEKVAEM